MVLAGSVGGFQSPAASGALGVAVALGARHAFDADHITSIDNVVRALKKAQKPSRLVGMFFSFGHSSVVLGFMIALWAIGQKIIEGSYGIVTTVSTVFIASFLLLIAWLNITALRESKPFSGGLVSKALARVFGSVSRQWQMILIGMIFGLGLDTAFALAVIASNPDWGLSGSEGIFYVSLALLFAGAMSFGDSINTLIVNRVYDSSNSMFVIRYSQVVSVIIIIAAVFVSASLWLSLLGVESVALDSLVEYFGYGLVIIFSVVLGIVAAIRRKRKNVLY